MIFEKQLINIIINKISEKKELTNLNKEFIEKQLINYFNANKKTYNKLLEKFKLNKNKIIKNKDFKLVIKEVRTKLREVFGAFYLEGFEKSESLINSITKNNVEEISFELLKFHRSTKERLRNYEEIYDKIFELTKTKPKVILDLASGYNVFSYYFLKESFQCSSEYICCDLSNKDIILFNKYFKNANIKGKAFVCDLTTEINKLKNIRSDFCFLFKTIDSLEAISKNFSKELLETIKTKYFIISFSTKSLGGNKKINPEKRAWFFKLIKKLGFSFQEFSIHNELFLVVKKT